MKKRKKNTQFFQLYFNCELVLKRRSEFVFQFNIVFGFLFSINSPIFSIQSRIICSCFLFLARRCFEGTDKTFSFRAHWVFEVNRTADDGQMPGFGGWGRAVVTRAGLNQNCVLFSICACQPGLNYVNSSIPKARPFCRAGRLSSIAPTHSHG